MPNSLLDALEVSLAEDPPLLALPLAEPECVALPLPLPEAPELVGKDAVADPEPLPEEVTTADEPLPDALALDAAEEASDAPLEAATKKKV